MFTWVWMHACARIYTFRSIHRLRRSLLRAAAVYLRNWHQLHTIKVNLMQRLQFSMLRVCFMQHIRSLYPTYYTYISYEYVCTPIHHICKCEANVKQIPHILAHLLPYHIFYMFSMMTVFTFWCSMNPNWTIWSQLGHDLYKPAMIYAYI